MLPARRAGAVTFCVEKIMMLASLTGSKPLRFSGQAARSSSWTSLKEPFGWVITWVWVRSKLPPR